MLLEGVVFASGFIVSANEKGWMDTGLVLGRVGNTWLEKPSGSLGLWAMFLLDAFRCHLDERMKDKVATCNTNLVVIPGSMTSQLQPLDVYHCYTFTPSNRMKCASLYNFAGWVKDAWCTIPFGVIMRISNSMDGTKDEML